MFNYEIAAAGQNDVHEIFYYLKANIDTYENLQSINYNKVLQIVYNNILTTYPKYNKIIYANIIIGFFSFIEGTDECELNGIYINKHYQHKGLGTSLLKKFISKSEQISKPITLYVFSRNIPAINLYKKYGFKIIEEHNSRFKMIRLS